MTNDDFAKKLIKIRKQNKISQSDLGKYLGVSNRAVSKWETGLSLPTIDNLYKLSKIFNKPVDYFVRTFEPREEEKSTVGMKSLRELYKVGRGPSSSHTIGPEKASMYFKEKNPDAEKIKVILYGSLAKTGKGHGTDSVIIKTLNPIKCEIEFNYSEKKLPHPNTMDFIAYKDSKETQRLRVTSPGGGRIEIENKPETESPDVYSLSSFEKIAQHCREKNLRLWQYAELSEGSGFREYMESIWSTMKRCIHSGLLADGILPGGLDVMRKAKQLYNKQHVDETSETRENRIVCSYAFAVSEQNACGEKIVTAPTCGAAGVLPAVLYYEQAKRGYTDDEVVNALMTAGIIGNLVKTNASISGAECGCQAEIGTACAMAAAALAELFNLDIDIIEYSAEIAIEHHLGLTCDPICGLVQIPCIERNAVAAMRAINAVNLASFLSDTRKISLDKVIRAMKETGLDILKQYKETSEGGLAKISIQ